MITWFSFSVKYTGNIITKTPGAKIMQQILTVAKIWIIRRINININKHNIIRELNLMTFWIFMFFQYM